VRIGLPEDWILQIKKRVARLLRLRSSFLPEENQLIVLAIAVGVLTGFGSVGFIKFIHAVTDFARGRVAAGLGFFFGPADIVLLPALGGLIVGPIIYHFAREARGHGVPEVMTALATAGGRIRPRVVLVKIAASATTIGFGGTASPVDAASIATSPCPPTHSGSGPSSGMPTKNFAAMQPPWHAS
jgi:H+/Cl- antiporter ClcA